MMDAGDIELVLELNEARAEIERLRVMVATRDQIIESLQRKLKEAE